MLFFSQVKVVILAPILTGSAAVNQAFQPHRAPRIEHRTVAIGLSIHATRCISTPRSGEPPLHCFAVLR
jgi:hypothetical protein